VRLKKSRQPLRCSDRRFLQQNLPEAAVSIRSKDSRYSTTSSARAGRSSSELIFDLWNFLRPIFFGPIIPV
jgi:hypothetical protein